MVRKFEIVKISFAGSLKKHSSIVGTKVSSSTPAGAAAKAFNASCKTNKTAAKCQSTITIKDITEQSGTSGKSYTYKLIRKVSPKKVMIGGKEITFKYDISMKAVKK
jgi:hypothetical protein